MDQLTDLQMPPAPAEQSPHLAYNPNSTTTTTTHVPNYNIPPYTDMIIAAISALKDKDGSSRQAIAKYIGKVYPNLPENHDNLLTNELKRLKNNGQLVMIKHSYALPRSDNFNFAGEFSQSPPPAAVSWNTENVSFSGSKRKPGRPPKTQTQPDFQQQQSAPAGFGAEPQGYTVSAAPGYTPEFQPYSTAPGFGSNLQAYQGAPGFGSDPQVYNTGPGHDVHHQHYGVGGPEPMFVSLGLDDGPVAVAAPISEAPPAEAVPPLAAAEATPTTVAKRGRGRPPKGSGASASPAVAAASANGLVPTDASGEPTSLGKRTRGRPAKPRSITEIMSNGGLKPKKGRGRAKANGPVIVPLADGSSPVPQSRPKSAYIPSGKPRGRPRKDSGAGVVAPPLLLEEGGARRPGRPARIGVGRKLYGKTMGRPRKDSAVNAIIVTDPHQLVGFQELKSKYEDIQLKVKQAASLLRPCLNHEGAINALAALQELEALASGDNPPVNVQTQEPQPPAPPPPQATVPDYHQDLF